MIWVALVVLAAGLVYQTAAVMRWHRRAARCWNAAMGWRAAAHDWETIAVIHGATDGRIHSESLAFEFGELAPGGVVRNGGT